MADSPDTSEEDDERWERIRSADRDLAESRESDDPLGAAKALWTKARSLYELKENAEAATTLDELLELIAHEPALLQERGDRRIRALLVRAHCRRRLNRRELAYADVEAVIAQAGSDPANRFAALSARTARLQWLGRDRRDAEIPPAAHELLSSLEPDETDELAEAARAAALGVWADAAGRAGDPAHAAQLREQLITGLTERQLDDDSRAIFDQRRKLGRDLFAAERFAQSAAVAGRLAFDLADGDIPRRDARIAEALSLRIYALSGAGELTQSVHAWEELVRRLGASDDADAQVSVSWSSAGLVSALLKAGDVRRAHAVISRELALFESETDPKLLNARADTLLELAGVLSQGAITTRRSAFTGAVLATAQVAGSGWMPGRRPAGERELLDDAAGWHDGPRWAATLRWARRLEDARAICTVLERRFEGDRDPRHFAIFVTALVRLSIVYGRQARPRAVARTIGRLQAIGAPAVAAIVDTAQPTRSGRYRDVARTAASLAWALPTLDTAPDPARTRAAVIAILEAQPGNPALKRLIRAQIRSIRARDAAQGR